MVTEEVVVTGAAWTTALGDGLEAVFERLLAGEHGFTEQAAPHPVRNPLLARVADAGSDPPAALRRMAEATAARALAGAGLDPNGAGAVLVLGTALGALPDDRAAGGPGAWVHDVAERFPGLEGEIALSTACSAGADAIAFGLELVRSGEAEICLCGGADVVTTAKRYGHSSLATMSPTRLRAFDRAHDGTLLGDGAAMVVLETAARARARGARADRVLRGAGSANDAASMTSPDPASRGARLAIERALADAGVTAGEIGLINAHGSGTPVNDALEVAVLQEVFGASGPLVFATKGAFGHTLGATGAIEAVALFLALERGEAPPVIGLDTPEGDLRLAVGRTGHGARLGASLTLGFGGFDTCLVCEVRR